MTKRPRRVTSGRMSAPAGNSGLTTAAKKTIVVLGDVTLDWLQEEIPRSQAGGERRHNYELYAGFRWTPVWGGAALVERLLDAAINTSPSLGARFKFTGVSALLTNKMIEENAHEFLQSLAVVKEAVKEEVEDKRKPIRVDSFRGFMATSIKPEDRKKLYPTEVSPLACIVIDDAANGCRDDEGFVDNLMKLAADAPLIVIKLSRPLDRNDLTEKLADLDPKPRRRIVVVVNADDLRAQGLDISRRLSWERSAIDLVSAAGASPILRRLSKIGDVLVRFGNDGCIVMERGHGQYLVFDPRRAEGTYDQDLSGTMPGATSAFTAQITASLLSGALLCSAVPQALCASRCLLKFGFSRRKPAMASDTKILDDYPLNVFGNIGLDDFVTTNLPDKIENLETWSILQAKLNTSPPDKAKKIALDLAKSIALEGYEKHLKDVPVASFGNLLLIDHHEIEGYRSIENLLREYINGRRHGGKPRPLSIAVFGPPGSGKSFGIKEIAKNIKDVEIAISTFNLTQFEGPANLVNAFHAARDEALKGRLPLLIFDEFDCSFGDQPWGWLKYFLAPMQDGEFNDDGRIHPLGHAVFAFAGGLADSFDEFNPDRKSSARRPKKPAKRSKKTEKQSVEPELTDKFKQAKGPDFASRLQGYVDVGGINPTLAHRLKDSELTKTKVDQISIVRRAILLRAKLIEQEHRTRNMNPIVNGKNRFDISDAVLDALLTVKRYRHGARSLESILTMSSLTDRDHFGVASLPSDEQLRIHVDASFIKILKKHAKGR
jgi:hypothetical protein